MSKKCTPLRREARLELKMYKHTMFGALLEVAMFKKCTPLWCEAHFEVNMYKTHQTRNAFESWDVEKVHAVVVQSTFRSQKCSKLMVSGHFWTFRYHVAWQAQGIVHLAKSEQNVRVLWHFQLQPPLHYTPLRSTTLQLWTAWDHGLVDWTSTSVVIRGPRSLGCRGQVHPRGASLEHPDAPSLIPQAGPKWGLGKIMAMFMGKMDENGMFSHPWHIHGVHHGIVEWYGMMECWLSILSPHRQHVRVAGLWAGQNTSRRSWALGARNSWIPVMQNMGHGMPWVKMMC